MTPAATATAVVMPSPIPPAELREWVYAGLEPWRTEEQHPHGEVAPVAYDTPEGARIYRALGRHAYSAAQQLGLDADRINFLYAKALRYEPYRGPLGWHCDTDAVGLDQGVELGLVEAWQAAEMRGRIVSCSVQLTDPEEYSGGLLKVRGDTGADEVMTTEWGAFVFFPSDRQHMVTQVTRGRRESLVMFAGYSPRG